MGTFIPNDIDAVKFIQATGNLTGIQKWAINRYVKGLKNNNLWSIFSGIYPFVGGTANSHSYNLKDISTYQITWAGGMTHNTLGIRSNGTTGYGNTTIPNNSLPTNSLHMAIYNRTSGQNGFDMGGDLTPRTQLVVNYNSGAFIGQTLYGLNETPSNNTRLNPPGEILGLTQTNRTSVTGTTLYSRGTVIDTDTTSSATPQADPFTICRILGGGTVSDRVYSYSSVGSGMTDAQALIHNDLVQQLQIDLGRNIY